MGKPGGCNAAGSPFVPSSWPTIFPDIQRLGERLTKADSSDGSPGTPTSPAPGSERSGLGDRQPEAGGSEAGSSPSQGHAQTGIPSDTGTGSTEGSPPEPPRGKQVKTYVWNCGYC